ncbi:hypothetical protein [Burkholderia sp. F1]|uniref:hypothetical protein n=1 Tax=Burkholderia sp. F1 TaxID=3366817 RepID=UPI003D763822
MASTPGRCYAKLATIETTTERLDEELAKHDPAEDANDEPIYAGGKVSVKYYALSRKNAPGCPIGMLNGALYDKYYPDTQAVEAGYFPWYANPSKGRAHEKFPSGLVFITQDTGYDFDARGDLGFYYLVSEKFNNLVSQFGVSIVDASPVAICSPAGEAIAGNCYHAAVFQDFPPETVANQHESQFVRGKFGGVSRIRKLVVNEGFSSHLFKVTGMEGSSNTLICSEVFRDAAIESGVKGIEFLDASAADWPAVSPI